MTQMTTDAEIRQWAKSVEDAFSFLGERGYVGPDQKLDAAWGSLSFRGTKLGIRLEVETDGFYMFLAVFPLDKENYADSKYLQECLKKLHIYSPELDGIHLFRGDFLNHNEIVLRFAKALQQNLDLLENNIGSLFSS